MKSAFRMPGLVPSWAYASGKCSFANSVKLIRSRVDIFKCHSVLPCFLPFDFMLRGLLQKCNLIVAHSSHLILAFSVVYIQPIFNVTQLLM